MKLYETDIEKIMKKALLKEHINFTEQYPIYCRFGYVLDFAIPNLKIDIETDGENFHPIGNSRDRKRNWFLRNKGWTILRFRGEQIRTDIKSCISEIHRVVRRLEKYGKES